MFKFIGWLYSENTMIQKAENSMTPEKSHIGAEDFEMPSMGKYFSASSLLQN
jgi:hypothetical protein